MLKNTLPFLAIWVGCALGAKESGQRNLFCNSQERRAASMEGESICLSCSLPPAGPASPGKHVSDRPAQFFNGASGRCASPLEHSGKIDDLQHPSRQENSPLNRAGVFFRVIAWTPMSIQ
ncbi:uncharacterized protein NEMAJ01_0673 [Nematocida major]|uniref:uncharacterized protein n=1 Tax=Nematocida major TaxID=1912982 RepID=UPI00200734AE|nr:uncharacterized protein NEMAJ01_0673 [Nematocida major]KAH9385777.1 hypothetical protein NEMAJ01_0673 [Nematocida major]